MSVKKLTNETFESAVSNGTVLVDFFAQWCGPCKMMSPIIDEIAEERTDITVAKLNVDDAIEIATKFNVVSIPTLVIFKDGKEISRIVGLQSKDKILSELN